MTELKNCTTNFFPELCGVNVVVDPQGVTSDDDDRVVIIGQKSDTGLAADFSLHKVTDSTRGLLFGINSVLDGQITDFLEVAPTAEVWAYVLPNTGTAANSTITVTGVDTATTTGVVLCLGKWSYISGFILIHPLMIMIHLLQKFNL